MKGKRLIKYEDFVKWSESRKQPIFLDVQREEVTSEVRDLQTGQVTIVTKLKNKSDQHLSILHCKKKRVAKLLTKSNRIEIRYTDIQETMYRTIKPHKNSSFLGVLGCNQKKMYYGKKPGSLGNEIKHSIPFLSLKNIQLA